MTFDPVAMADLMADTNVRNHKAGHHDLPRKGCALCEPVRFFFDNAGFSYDPNVETAEEGKLRTASDLAMAEAWGKANGLTFVWEFDHDDSSDGDETPEVREACIAYVDGDVVASLGGIGDATDDYRRVVEAELAVEAALEVSRKAIRLARIAHEAPEAPEEPDMRAHRLADAIVKVWTSEESEGLYNDARNVLIAEFTRGEA